MKVNGLLKPPYPCPNCNEPVDGNKVFCTELCQQEADLVRYFRRTSRDERFFDPEVQQAIKFRFAHVLSGGYPEQERQVSPATRAVVIARAGGKCQSCGMPGSEIDHIDGGSGDLDNLQYLCKPCHNKKTEANLRPVRRGSRAWFKGQLLIQRMESSKPLLLCDDPDKWLQFSLSIRREGKRGVSAKPATRKPAIMKPAAKKRNSFRSANHASAEKRKGRNPFSTAPPSSKRSAKRAKRSLTFDQLANMTPLEAMLATGRDADWFIANGYDYKLWGCSFDEAAAYDELYQ